MKTMNEATIGIIGGAGPMASCLLNQYLVEICQQKYGCVEDRDFPRIITYSFPFSSMLNAADATIQSERITQELAFCINEVSHNRSLVHWDCL